MTGVLLHPRALQGDDANDGYVLRTVGGVPMWMPGSIPAGGVVNQVLTKASATDYDVVWADPAAGGGSGTSLGRPNGTLVRKYDFTSGTQSWTASSGTLAHDATNGRLQHTAGSTSATIVLLEPSGAGNVANGEFVIDLSEHTIGSTNLDTGLFFRVTDANNLYMIAFRLVGTGGVRVELFKRVAGTYTSLGASAGLSNQWRFPVNGVLTARMMVRFVGSHITTFLNESFVGEWNDTTFTTGYCGVRQIASTSSTEVSYYDDAIIYSLSSSWKYPAYS